MIDCGDCTHACDHEDHALLVLPSASKGFTSEGPRCAYRTSSLGVPEFTLHVSRFSVDGFWAMQVNLKDNVMLWYFVS